MSRRRHTDAALLAGIAEATAAWNAEQDTAYYAERFGYASVGKLRRHLLRLAAAGQLVRSGTTQTGYTWRIK